MEKPTLPSYTLVEAMEQYAKAQRMLREMDMPKAPPGTPRHFSRFRRARSRLTRS
jgi:hypothetical protein